MWGEGTVREAFKGMEGHGEGCRAASGLGRDGTENLVISRVSLLAVTF